MSINEHQGIVSSLTFLHKIDCLIFTTKSSKQFFLCVNIQLIVCRNQLRQKENFIQLKTRFFGPLRVCPREDQAGVTHAISPISLKLSQMIKVIKLFKRPKQFGLPVNPQRTRAFTSNPRDKTPKLALLLSFQKRSLTLIECG